MVGKTYLYRNQISLGLFRAHLLLDLSIGSLYNDLLPSSSGGSGVLLHSLLLSQSSCFETKEGHIQY